MMLTEEHKARLRENVAKARRKWEAMRFRRPPQGTPERNLYDKLRRELGVEKARESYCARK